MEIFCCLPIYSQNVSKGALTYYDAYINLVYMYLQTCVGSLTRNMSHINIISIASGSEEEAIQKNLIQGAEYENIDTDSHSSNHKYWVDNTFRHLSNFIFLLTEFPPVKENPTPIFKCIDILLPICNHLNVEKLKEFFGMIMKIKPFVNDRNRFHRLLYQCFSNFLNYVSDASLRDSLISEGCSYLSEDRSQLLEALQSLYK